MKELARKLREMKIGMVGEHEPLASHTTIKIGGPADLLVEPSSVDNLVKTMEVIREAGVKWTAIGRGSNLLVSDNGIEGVVIKLGTGLDHVEVDGTTLKAGSGVSVVALAM